MRSYVFVHLLLGGCWVSGHLFVGNPPPFNPGFANTDPLTRSLTKIPSLGEDQLPFPCKGHHLGTNGSNFHISNQRAGVVWKAGQQVTFQ